RVPIFLFQAEDGIRDRNVTGVQTCALPILFLNRIDKDMPLQSDIATKYALKTKKTNLSNKDVQSSNPYNLYKYSGYGPGPFNNRSEERRVGKEGECRRQPARAQTTGDTLRP